METQSEGVVLLGAIRGLGQAYMDRVNGAGRGARHGWELLEGQALWSGVGS